jgi:hypothetical protein
MRIDFDRSSRLNEEEQALVKFLHAARAVAGSAVIGGIALIAVTADSGDAGGELASVRGAAAPVSAPAQGSLMALEHGALG